MAFSRPALVDQSDLHINGKLYSDATIAKIMNVIKGDPAFIPRTKLNIDGVKVPFSITRMDGEVYAVYKGTRYGKHLGAGNFGKVKLAQNLKTGEWVALKISRYKCDQYLDLLKSEVAINKKLGFAKSVLYEHEGRRFDRKHVFMIALAHGKQMGDIFYDQNNPKASSISFKERMWAAMNAVQALIDIHNEGVLHCDLKLENMFYDEKTGKVTILDFGLSLLMNGDGKARDLFRGTAFAIPPELNPFREYCEYSAETDTFAMGIAMIDIFGYRYSPDHGGAYNAICRPIDPKDPSNEHEVALVGLINRMTSREPDKRPDLSSVLNELKLLYPQIQDSPKATRKRKQTNLFSNDNSNNDTRMVSVHDNEEKPKAMQLLALLKSAKTVYEQIEGKQGVKGKKIRSGKHLKDLTTIISECENACRDPKFADKATVVAMVNIVNKLCFIPANRKYSKKSARLFCGARKLEDHLNDPKNEKHHHMTRLMFAVMDAARRSDILPADMNNMFPAILGVNANIIPERYKGLYLEIYKLLERNGPRIR